MQGKFLFSSRVSITIMGMCAVSKELAEITSKNTSEVTMHHA